jgi:YggT family protein
LEVVLVFRFFLKLFGANPFAGFTSFIYGVSQPFVQPFLTVFRITRVEGSIFEWTTLLAMAVYYLIAWGIIELFIMGKPVSTPEAAEKLDQQDR